MLISFCNFLTGSKSPRTVLTGLQRVCGCQFCNYYVSLCVVCVFYMRKYRDSSFPSVAGDTGVHAVAAASARVAVWLCVPPAQHCCCVVPMWHCAAVHRECAYSILLCFRCFYCRHTCTVHPRLCCRCCESWPVLMYAGRDAARCHALQVHSCRSSLVSLFTACGSISVHRQQSKQRLLFECLALSSPRHGQWPLATLLCDGWHSMVGAVPGTPGV